MLALGDTTHARTPAWPLAGTHSARLKGRIYRSRGGKKKLWDLSDRPLPKNVSIWFDLQTNTPPPFNVHWQAGRSNGRWEDTKYRGTHAIEAFVVKNGACVARTGRTLVRIR